MNVSIDYCGEVIEVPTGGSVVIGREADMVIDESNTFLHRRFLEIAVRDGLCWITNIGATLSATVTDAGSRVQAWIPPGARIPLVFELSHVRFSAGPTTYEFEVHIAEPPFAAPIADSTEVSVLTATVGQIPMTPDQLLLVVALAEPLLRQEGRGTAAVPSNAAAAERLGWRLTRFNRKLDNVCEKLSRSGVRGLHGEPGRLASNRRARLVEYAVGSGLVSVADLPLLDNRVDTSSDRDEA